MTEGRDPNSPKELFESFVESGAKDFEAFVANYPKHAESLKALFERREEVARELEGSAMDESFFRGQSTMSDVDADVSWTGRNSGEVIGDFRLISPLGRGGMGQVWEAEQTSMGRKVALKLLHAHVQLSDDGVMRFEREAKAGGKLAHPGIVQIHSVGVADGAHFMAQELVEGSYTLADSLADFRAETELPPGYYRKVAELFAEMAEALSHAHENGVVHRDIKPSNILIGPDEKPKVADFGLAMVEDQLGLSQTGDFMGTPFYMSPEQAASKRMGIDHRTDVFSLGATLYEALTLTRPFTGDTSQQVFQQILVVDPPDPKQLRSRVPRDLAVICLKALEKNQDQRYVTMEEFGADLRRHLSDEPIMAKPPTILQRTVKWTRRNPTKSTVVGVTALALAAISWLFVDNVQKTLEAEEGWMSASKNSYLAVLNATEARAEQLLNLSTKLRDDEPSTSLLLAIEAVDELEKMMGSFQFVLTDGVFPSDMISHKLIDPPVRARIFDQELLAAMKAAGAMLSLDGRHKGLIDVVVSPSGERISTISNNGVIHLWNLTTGELLWMSEALMGGYGTLGIHRGATPVVDAFMARPPFPKFKAYFLDEADGALEPADDRLLVFMHNEPGAPCYLFDVESGSLLRDLSPGLDATARTGWLLSHSKLPSAEVMESMKASRGMYSRFTDFSRFEDWWWCTSTQVSWCLHRTVDRALGVVDLQSGEVLQKMKGRSPIIHSSGKRFAYILGSDLVIEEIGSASREVIEISDIAKPRIIQSANEAWFVIASSPGDEDLNVGESIQLYRWDHLHFKPEFVRTYHVSSLLLGRVYPWIIPEANLILLSNSAGEVLLLPMDPVAHAKKYCADMGVALPGWRRAAMGLPQEEGG